MKLWICKACTGAEFPCEIWVREENLEPSRCPYDVCLKQIDANWKPATPEELKKRSASKSPNSRIAEIVAEMEMTANNYTKHSQADVGSVLKTWSRLLIENGVLNDSRKID